MKFGMFTSGYQRLPLEKCFTDAAQLGYDYIELWGGYPHAFAPDVIEDYREIRRLQEHYGIPVPVYTPEHNAYPYNYMLGTEKQWRNCMAYLEVSVRAAGLIGAGQMLISVGHGGECRRNCAAHGCAALWSILPALPNGSMLSFCWKRCPLWRATPAHGFMSSRNCWRRWTRRG